MTSRPHSSTRGTPPGSWGADVPGLRASLLVLAATAALSACAPHTAANAQASGYGPAPDFTLPNVAGGDFTLGAQRGSVVVLSFTAANCTEECPVLEAVLQRAARAWKAQGILARRVTIATVEIDPKTNGAAAVAKLRAKWWPQPGWAFLRSDAAATAPVLKAYNILVLPPPKGHADVEHTVEVYVIDPHGNESDILAPGANLSVPALERAVKRAYTPSGKA
ncbi:SCO family protein [bacterium]|nr:MAG: SCO family protein [bacterium]